MKNKGITLVALVITIIVLLILSGVTIASLSGDNGILRRAVEARNSTVDSQIYEQVQMILLETRMEIENSNQDEIKTKVDDKFKKEKIEATIEKREDGFVVVCGKYNKKILYLDSKLGIINEEKAVVGKSTDWDYIVNPNNTVVIKAYKKDISGHFDIPNIIEGYLVTELGDDVFNYATNMTSMTLPIGLEKIGARTFAFCSNLEWEVAFPSTLKSIGEKAFYGCGKITGKLEEIMNTKVIYGQGVFMKCSRLTGDIQILMNMLGEQDTIIEDGLFNGFSGATGTLVIPARITSIGANAFYGCSGINKIVFESNTNLKNIGNSAFYQCTNMAGILDIPDSVETIGEYAFYEDKGLTGLNLSTTLSTLGRNAFYKCNNIAGTVIIPETLEVLEEEMFCDCFKIDTIKFMSNGNKGVKIIKRKALFNSQGLKKIIFPETLTKIEEWAMHNCTMLENLELPTNLKYIEASAFRDCSKLDILSWPSNLQSIGSEAFMNCINLKEIPNFLNINKIDREAFINCNLLGTRGENNIINAIRNSKMTFIGNEVFKDCVNLIGEYLGEILNSSGTKINIIGAPFVGTKVNLARKLDFNGKTSILANEYQGTTKFVDNSGNEITQINIPDTVTSIGNNAFSGCTSITSVNIPNSVTRIGSYCFSSCTSLTNIRLPENKLYQTMENGLLDGCKSLKQINIPTNIININYQALARCGFERLNIPGNVKNLYSASIQNNFELVELKLNEGIERLGSQFISASKVTKLDIPNSVINIEEAALYYCRNLKSLTIGSGMTYIPNRLLWSTNSVENIIIKGKVTKIGNEAFNDSVKLNTLKMDWSNVISIGDKAFGNCGMLKGNIKLNPNCSIAETAFNGCGLNITK